MVAPSPDMTFVQASPPSGPGTIPPAAPASGPTKAGRTWKVMTGIVGVLLLVRGITATVVAVQQRSGWTEAKRDLARPEMARPEPCCPFVHRRSFVVSRRSLSTQRATGAAVPLGAAAGWSEGARRMVCGTGVCDAAYVVTLSLPA